MRIIGYVESVGLLPANPGQDPLNCIMVDGVPIMAQKATALNFAVGDEVDIAVRVTSKRVPLAQGDPKVFRTFWFSALVKSSGQTPKVYVNGNGVSHSVPVVP